LIESTAGEPPNNDDELDALSWPANSGAQPYFTLAPGSPTLSFMGVTAADILTRVSGSPGPSVAVSGAALGLGANDAVDALCLVGIAQPNRVLFSLAPGSPALAGPDGVLGTADDLSPADILQAGPNVFRRAGAIGLLPTDNLDAMKCQELGPPLPPTPAPVPTAPAGIGGRGLTLTSLPGGQVRLSWIGGTTQGGYRLMRITSQGETPVVNLNASATSFVDTVPQGLLLACYRLAVLSAAGAQIASSDILCIILLELGSPPTEFSATLNQSNLTTLSWGAPGAGGHTNFVLIPLGTNRVQVLPASATGATDNTNTRPICYLVAAVGATGFIGFSDAICVIPGTATNLAAAPRDGQLAAAEPPRLRRPPLAVRAVGRA
jgi:hypothetical protein